MAKPKPEEAAKAKAEAEENEEDEDTPPGYIEVPASYVDTYWISYWPDRIRMAFAEKFKGRPPQFRAAVIMPMESVEELIKTLIEIRDEMKAPKKE